MYHPESSSIFLFTIKKIVKKIIIIFYKYVKLKVLKKYYFLNFSFSYLIN